ncbi:hypothetical protein FH972_003001 [Carpinus fangiana]|uniref:Uncharacterized protein n=1 Tax=Carpinus fangiana TaxID=176857 RepID=A0A5N6QGL6_9ROSI|nr:hypothetical protein FH972_003001 [Carpinus fangiana]
MGALSNLHNPSLGSGRVIGVGLWVGNVWLLPMGSHHTITNHGALEIELLSGEDAPLLVWWGTLLVRGGVSCLSCSIARVQCHQLWTY